MRESDFNFACPFCDHVSYSDGKCPECEVKLEKLTGEERFQDDSERDEFAVEPMAYDDDPDSISWTDEKEGAIETI